MLAEAEPTPLPLSLKAASRYALLRARSLSTSANLCSMVHNMSRSELARNFVLAPLVHRHAEFLAKHGCEKPTPEHQQISAEQRAALRAAFFPFDQIDRNEFAILWSKIKELPSAERNLFYREAKFMMRKLEPHNDTVTLAKALFEYMFFYTLAIDGRL